LPNLGTKFIFDSISLSTSTKGAISSRISPSAANVKIALSVMYHISWPYLIG